MALNYTPNVKWNFIWYNEIATLEELLWKCKKTSTQRPDQQENWYVIQNTRSNGEHCRLPNSNKSTTLLTNQTVQLRKNIINQNAQLFLSLLRFHSSISCLRPGQLVTLSSDTGCLLKGSMPLSNTILVSTLLSTILPLGRSTGSVMITWNQITKVRSTKTST